MTTQMERERERERERKHAAATCATLSDLCALSHRQVTPVVEQWLEREIAQWIHHEGSIRRPIAL